MTTSPEVADGSILAGLDAEQDAEAVVEAAARDDARRRRRVLILLVLAFVVTRAVAGYVADHPTVYGPADRVADGTGDVGRYDLLTWEMRHEDAGPYTTLGVEYPPGILPVLFVPRYLRAASYRTEFIVMMVAFDALGLVALARLARRRASWWGFATWFVLIPLLGPVAYTRFDLVVGVALVWAIERMAAGRWTHVGALIGVGAAVKLVPILLLPVVLLAAPRAVRKACALAAAAVVALSVLPFVLQLGALYRSVLVYHADRGVQAESIWGAGLLVARRLYDYPVQIVSSHLAWDAVAPSSDTWKTVSNVLCIAVVIGCTVLAAKARDRRDPARLSVLLFATLALLVGLGSVYSPQYLVWVIALAAGAAALAPRAALPAVGVLAVTVGLAHLEFPVWFWDLLFFDKGGALVDLVVRDVLTVATGLIALGGWFRAGRRSVSVS